MAINIVSSNGNSFFERASSNETAMSRVLKILGHLQQVPEEPAVISAQAVARAHTIVDHLRPVKAEPSATKSLALFRAHAIVDHLRQIPEAAPVKTIKSALFRFRRLVRKVLELFSRDPQGKIYPNTTPMCPREWIEVFSPEDRKRRPGLIRAYFDKWRQDPQLQGTVSFNDYVKREEDSDPNHPLKSVPILHYCTAEERAQYEATIKPNAAGEAVVDFHGQPLEDGVYIVILSADNKLYAAQKLKGNLHHSTFVEGKSVLAAGRFVIKNGVLVKFLALSGHYTPGEKMNRIFADYFNNCGVDPKTYEFLTYDQIMEAKRQKKLAKNPGADLAQLEKAKEEKKRSRQEKFTLPKAAL
jgi:hypothetical protein